MSVRNNRNTCEPLEGRPRMARPLDPPTPGDNPPAMSANALPIVNPPARQAPRTRPDGWTLVVRSYRLFVVLLAGLLIHVATKSESLQQAPTAVSLIEARRIFPQAARLSASDRPADSAVVRDVVGQTLGLILKTSPETDDLIGYAGPSNLLVGLDPTGRVVRVELLWSRDTVDHVQAVKRQSSFWRQFSGWIAGTPPPGSIDGVSGSTLTSLAMVEAVQRRLGNGSLSLRFPQSVTLDEARELYPQAAALLADTPRPGWFTVQASNQTVLGYLLRTSPEAENAIGYSGPTEALIAVSVAGEIVTGVRMRQSYDTPEYVDRVRTDPGYLTLLAGRTLHEWADLDFQKAGIEGVSGATQTSYALAEGIRRRAKAEISRATSDAPGNQFPWRTTCQFVVIAGALVLTFTRFRGSGWRRVLWQLALVLIFFCAIGDLLSLSLFAGWSRHGIPWQSASGLVVLAALALVIPATSKQQMYCHQVCPHGAVQEWMGRARRWQFRLPPRIAQWLSDLPATLLVAAFVLAVFGPQFDLANLEPFDAWSLHSSLTIPVLLAITSLAASLFIPQGYCRYGCPTGALLKFVRAHGTRERFGRTELLATAVVVVCGAVLVGRERLETNAGNVASISEIPQLSGDAFGTTWTLKVRRGTVDLALRDVLVAELERLESRLSHWRAESETAQFNASETTLEMDASDELRGLVRQAMNLSEATSGAFDITVGPLVALWGFGPSGPRSDEPPREEIAQALAHVGWRKLHLDDEWKSLQKDTPRLQIDLGALLQGYALDRLADILDHAGIPEYLLEIGGELRAKGAWQVAIEDPADPQQVLKTLELRDAALSTSGTYRRQPDGSTRRHHLISPQTGRPLESPWTLCAVIAPTGLAADAWDTALLVSDPTRTLEIADTHDVAAVLVDGSGRVVLTEAAKRLLGNDAPP